MHAWVEQKGDRTRAGSTLADWNGIRSSQKEKILEIPGISVTQVDRHTAQF